MTRRSSPLQQAQIFDLVKTTLVALHPQEPSLHRALERATKQLLNRPWLFDPGTYELRVYSRRNANVLYRCESTSCLCEAPKGVLSDGSDCWCWHRAAALLLQSSYAMHIPVQSVHPLPKVLEKHARWLVLFPQPA